MKRFMKHDFIIKSIELACLVKAGQGSNVHKNRKNHGLAFFPDGERIFYFDNKKDRETDSLSFLLYILQALS